MDFVSFLLCVSFMALIAAAFLSNARIFKPTSARLPPGPTPFPVVGNLLKLVGEKPHKSLAELAKIHGPIMSLRILTKTTVVISSASMAKEVLQKQDISFSTHRDVPDCMRAHQHHTLSVAWGHASANWRNLRTLCRSYVFNAHALDDSSHLRRQKVQDLLAAVGESCSRGTGVDIGRMAFATTINLLSNTMLSMDWADPRSDGAQEYKKVVCEILGDIGKLNLVDYFPALRKIDPQGIRRRAAANMRKLFVVFDSVIDRRLQSRKLQSRPVANKDTLDTLLDNTDLSSNDIRHLLLDLFVAGTDTTSSTVEWAMAELLHNPTILSKLREEMAQIIGKGNPIEEKDIPKLPYLQAIIKETLRLHPGGPFLVPRRVETEVKICGYVVPKGTQVLVNIWAMGRDPKIWADPDSFMPERFLGSDVNVKGSNFELIPFGAGRRICPGLPLGLMMVHLMVGSLIHNFEWGFEHGVAAETMDMEEKFGLILKKVQPLVAVPRQV